MAMDKQKLSVAIACSTGALEDHRYTRGFKFLSEELSTKYSIQLCTVLWDDPGVEWETYAMILALGITDYIERKQEVEQWLEMIKDKGLDLYNRPDVIRWNFHKGYLIQLQKLGVCIPRTILLHGSEKADHEIITEGVKYLSSDEIIVKPAFGRDSLGLEKISNRLPLTTFADMLKKGDMIAQEFLPCIVTSGEIQCFFIGGHLTGSIRKYPDPKHAGKVVRIERCDPDPDVLQEARRVYRITKRLLSPREEFLYARVDLIPEPETGRIMLNEFEVLEPLISYDGKKTEAIRLAEEIFARCNTKNKSNCCNIL